MKKKQIHPQPLTPAALYARVSSDRQDVDLSVSAQLRALKEYAKANDYSVAREYVDEAESGRVADRPQFREMIEEGGKPKAPFDVILVWKFSRFTRKREHAVAFKSQLRRKGIRVVSITEQAEDNATGRLLEGIIESVDEYYSENLAQEVVRGMREAASRGFFLGSNAPFGYRKIKVSDGAKERPTLEVDPATAPVVKELFEKSLRGSGLKELCKELNDRGITIRERILNEETIVALVTLVAEEIDAMAGELSGRLEVVEAELSDVRKRLEKLYEAIETSELTLEVLSPRIMSLRHREEQLEAAREDAETQLEQRRVDLPDTEEIARYVADFRDFLKDGTIPERKALIRNFVEGIEVDGDEATLTYTVPMPSDGVMSGIGLGS